MQRDGERIERLHPRLNFPSSVRGAEWALLLVGVLLMAAAGLLHVSEVNWHWMLWVHGSEPALHLTWASLTLLGFGWPVLILGAAHAGRCGVRLSVFLKTALLAMLMAQVPKALWLQPRPAAALDVAQLHIVGEAVVHTSSMPSGHALAVFAMLAAAWMVRVQLGPSLPRGTVALGWCAALVLVMAVAWSRVAVGAHWPADVLAGAGAGLWAAAGAWRWERAAPWGRWFEGGGGQRAVCVFLLLAAAAWAWTATGYPQASWLQWLLAVCALVEAVRRLRFLRAVVHADSAEQASRVGS